SRLIEWMRIADRTSMPIRDRIERNTQPNTTKDKFGDDLMIKAETTPQGADDAAKIIAVCRGIRHILTPVAWIICTALVAYTTIYLNR
uniref:hypothetical protein n=1 Tax=Escherichia coli TaxID=562 RepID=UPI001BC82FF8